ncbi:metal-dependent hydrolase [Gammaproteobacteria bacterium 42_54_T18]|nr:metal-dependent hydrolase [Gammaproteobacteria bacterium 42_54_T18]
MLKNANIGNGRHAIKGRDVQFDFSDTNPHWLKDDPFSSHFVNSFHLVLPPGERYFCRVFAQALPLITDNELREDVKGFIHQEAIHSRQHTSAQIYLESNGYNYEHFNSKLDWVLEQVFGDSPFGMNYLKNRYTKDIWLTCRVGFIATMEHFTGFLGQWGLDNESWDKNGDATIVDLFKWHLAEEVEHRTVAFDLFEHLCTTKLGFYVSRQAQMVVVAPLFIHFIFDAFRVLVKQDEDRSMQKLGAKHILHLLAELEKVGKRTQNVPTFSFFVRETLRWVNPFFHPLHEGDTQQALDYLAQSPAAIAAADSCMK